MAITVANKRDRPKGIAVHRPTPLGNPFELGRGMSRELAVDKYADWLDAQLADAASPAATMFASLLRQARRGDLTLICYCAPLACHADVIKARLEAALLEEEG